MVKTVVFGPGLDCKDQAPLQPVIELIEARGFAFEFVPIEWEGTTLTDWHEQFRSACEKHDTKEMIACGFSIGAVTALSVAATRPPSALWLFSLSARFAEDIPQLPKEQIDYLGPERMQVFAKQRFADIAPRITCPTLLLHGSKERSLYPTLVHRVEEASRLIRGSRLVVAKKSGHNLTHSGYLKAIAQSIA